MPLNPPYSCENKDISLFYQYIPTTSLFELTEVLDSEPVVPHPIKHNVFV
jgi:hypothetical protein